MKRIFYIFILMILSSTLAAQTGNYISSIEQFQKNFNTGKYNEIFKSFSSEMKQSLPIEQNKQFLSDLKNQVGNMKSTKFTGYEQSTYAAYKTQFEKGILMVNISLDSQNKINGLFIKPYEDLGKIINALNSYPKKIAETIYSTVVKFPENTQLSVAIVQNGKTDYYGIIKEHDSIKPVENQNKVFEIGSISKVFTSTVLASLAESNKIKLTDTINSYYSFPFKDNRKISFEDLANHTSGLPRLPQNLNLSDINNPYQGYHTKELEDYLKNLMTIEHKTSKNFSYSNLGVGLLGYTLGLSQKATFQNVLQKTVFDKYGMTQSFTTSQNLGDILIKGHTINGVPVSNWDWDVLFGAGGILSTTGDLVKFVKAQFNPKNKELALTRKSTFTVNAKTKIGLGWHIITTKNNKEVLFHNGGTGGYSSSITLNMENETAVIILSNASSINESIDHLCFELLTQTIQK